MIAISSARRAREVGEFLPQRFAALVENLPHEVGRALVGHLVVAFDRLLHDDGRRRDSAVIEVDDLRADRVARAESRSSNPRSEPPLLHPR